MEPLPNRRLRVLVMSRYQCPLTCWEYVSDDFTQPVNLLNNAATGVMFQMAKALCPFSSSTVSVCYPVDPNPFFTGTC